MSRPSYKWRQYPDDVYAACVAEMDLRVAPEIAEVMLDAVRQSDCTYPLRSGKKADRAVASAFSTYMHKRFDWQPNPDHVVVVADLVQAIYAAIKAYSTEGDGVIVQTPNYPPFREAIDVTDRRLIPLPMEKTATGYEFDLDALAKRIDARTKLLILCNPQNPTGRVFTEKELTDLLTFADRHDLIIVSDEIHADLIYPGSQHIPLAALPGGQYANIITLNSATKSFNIPGLRCAVMHFSNSRLFDTFQRAFPPRLIGAVNNLGIDATVIAWQQCDDWLKMIQTHLLNMRDHSLRRLGQELPDVKFFKPEATYLLWMDCSALQLPGSAGKFFLDHARVGLSHGEAFEPNSNAWVRLNFATSPTVLNTIIDRMVSTVERYRR